MTTAQESGRHGPFQQHFTIGISLTSSVVVALSFVAAPLNNNAAHTADHGGDTAAVVLAAASVPLQRPPRRSTSPQQTTQANAQAVSNLTTTAQPAAKIQLANVNATNSSPNFLNWFTNFSLAVGDLVGSLPSPIRELAQAGLSVVVLVPVFAVLFVTSVVLRVLGIIPAQSSAVGPGSELGASGDPAAASDRLVATSDTPQARHAAAVIGTGGQNHRRGEPKTMGPDPVNGATSTLVSVSERSIDSPAHLRVSNSSSTSIAIPVNSRSNRTTSAVRHKVGQIPKSAAGHSNSRSEARASAVR